MSTTNSDKCRRRAGFQASTDVCGSGRVSVENSQVVGLTGIFLLVSIVVSISWLIGCLSFSFVWVLILIACLFMVWKSKISRIVKHHLNVKETVLYRKRAFRHNESAEWLNFVLNRWWVFSSHSIEKLVKRHLDERLWSIKPSFVGSLELIVFSTGDQTPTFRNMKMLECSEGSRDVLCTPHSWSNINKPPVGLDKMANYQLVLQCDLQLIADDFKMIYRTRLGSQKVNMGFDIAVEELHLSGSIQIVFYLSMDVSFPHISKASMSFIERPDVNFNLRMMRALQMIEVPLLKRWIHTNILDGLTNALVDPASIDLMLATAGPIEMSSKSRNQPTAQGVLTIHLNGTPPSKSAEDMRYTVLRIGDHRRQTRHVSSMDTWSDMSTFFVHSLGTDQITVKSKCQGLLTSTTLDHHIIKLSAFPFQVKSFAETTLENKDGSKLNMSMQYSALPVVNLDCVLNERPKKVSTSCGVMYVCIHGASNVQPADKTGASDPYCIFFCNRRRFLTTPYVCATRNPRWETAVEFFVADFTQCTYSFFVYDWDGTNTVNDDFLGVTHLNLQKDNVLVVKQRLTLGYNRPDEGFTPDAACGQITVSFAFRPVASVARSEQFQECFSNEGHDDSYLYREDLVSPASKDDSHRSKSPEAYMDDILEDKLIVELTILQGKELVSKDRNGFSDPFCIVSIDGKKVFTTSVKKKTLFPKWNEQVTAEMEHCDSTLTIEVFDKDVISKEFMGVVNFTTDKLKELSLKGATEWFALEKVMSGKLQVKCQVICKDTLNNSAPVTLNEFTSSPVNTDQKCLSPISCNNVKNQSKKAGKLSISGLLMKSFLGSAGSTPSPDYTIDFPSQVKVTGDDGNAEIQPLIDLSTLPCTPPVMHRSTSHLSINADPSHRSTSDLISNADASHRSTSDLIINSDSSHRSQPSMDAVSGGGGLDMLNVLRMVSAPLIQEVFKSFCVQPVAAKPVDVSSNSEQLSSSVAVLPKRLYRLNGTVHRARGMLPDGRDVYCKVRLESHGSHMSLFSGARVIAKSKFVPTSAPIFDINFDIDYGQGVSPDAVLVFDIKYSAKELLATHFYSLRQMMGNEEGVSKWMPIQNGIEIEVSMSTNIQPQHVRRRNVLRRFSFRSQK